MKTKPKRAPSPTAQAPAVPNLRVTRRPDGWVVSGLPSADVTEAGPYDTRREADEIRVGLLRFYRYAHSRAFVTCVRHVRPRGPTVDR